MHQRPESRTHSTLAVHPDPLPLPLPFPCPCPCPCPMAVAAAAAAAAAAANSRSHHRKCQSHPLTPPTDPAPVPGPRPRDRRWPLPRGSETRAQRFTSWRPIRRAGEGVGWLTATPIVNVGSPRASRASNRSRSRHGRLRVVLRPRVAAGTARVKGAHPSSLPCRGARAGRKGPDAPPPHRPRLCEGNRHPPPGSAYCRRHRPRLSRSRPPPPRRRPCHDRARTIHELSAAADDASALGACSVKVADGFRRAVKCHLRRNFGAVLRVRAENVTKRAFTETERRR